MPIRRASTGCRISHTGSRTITNTTSRASHSNHLDGSHHLRSSHPDGRQHPLRRRSNTDGSPPHHQVRNRPTRAVKPEVPSARSSPSSRPSGSSAKQAPTQTLHRPARARTPPPSTKHPRTAPDLLRKAARSATAKFEFTARKVDCGKRRIGSEYLDKRAQGQFCLVHVKVANIGSEPQLFDDSNQKALD